MTSAARPTWSAALASGGGLRDGSSSAPTLQTCAKDQPARLRLKLRQFGQDSPEEIQARTSTKPLQTPKISSSLIAGDSDEEINEDGGDEDDQNFISRNSEDEQKHGSNHQSESAAENDDVSNDRNELDNIYESYGNDDDDEDEDEAELLRELEKIKKEREAEKLAKEAKNLQKNPHAVLAGNPLLASIRSETTSESSFGVKRRWDEDVVFKNQAKGLDEAPKKRFINDTTRSDFHRRFMDKFIK